MAALGLAAFFLRQARARNPLFDLHVAARRIFWVAAVAGLVVFGTLMGAVFVAEQFLQDVLGYSTLRAGTAVLPAALAMLVAAPFSARLIARVGSRATLLAGYGFLLAAFVVMLSTWTGSAGYLPVGAALVLLGAGVGLSGTPASHALTGSVPVGRAGMASGTADLQRDLGGAVMQSILGAILSAGYATAVGRRIAATHTTLTPQVTTVLERSFASAADFAAGRPAERDAIIAGARASFLHGADAAYVAGALAIVAGAALVGLAFPGRRREEELLGAYQREDSASAANRSTEAARRSAVVDRARAVRLSSVSSRQS